MKANNMVLMVVVALFSTATLMAQPADGSKGRGHGGDCIEQREQCGGIPNITDEQKTQLDGFRLSHMKQMQPLKNKMQELKARQHSLETAEKADLKAINANIDEMTKLQNQMMKAKAEHRQQVRSVLNDEQRLWFDNQKHGGKGGFGPDGQKGQRHGQRD